MSERTRKNLGTFRAKKLVLFGIRTVVVDRLGSELLQFDPKAAAMNITPSRQGTKRGLSKWMPVERLNPPRLCRRHLEYYRHFGGNPRLRPPGLAMEPFRAPEASHGQYA